MSLVQLPPVVDFLYDAFDNPLFGADATVDVAQVALLNLDRRLFDRVCRDVDLREVLLKKALLQLLQTIQALLSVPNFYE